MTLRPKVLRFNLAVACMMSALGSQAAVAADFGLDGLWFEADNYPASSVMRFSRYGKGWIGRYVQVSPPQMHLGFRVGETVIRGTIEGTKFVGQVLLKPIDGSPICTNLTVGWVPIKMTFVGTNQLSGAWLQTWVEDGQACVTVDQTWQSYRLERLPTE